MPFMNMREVSTLGHTFRNFDHSIITVRVGNKGSQEPFSCHKELLRRCSEYFDTALAEKKESPYKNTEETLQLNDVSPDVFDAFMVWLYTGFVPHHLIEGGKEVHPPTHAMDSKSSNSESPTVESDDTDDIDTESWDTQLGHDDTTPDSTSPPESTSPTRTSTETMTNPSTNPSNAPPPTIRNTSEKPDSPHETLCPCCSKPYAWRGSDGFLERRFIALYIFGTTYRIPALRRAVLLAWQTADETLHCIPDHSNVIAAYASLPPSSPLCRYFLDMYSIYWNPDRDHEFAMPLRAQLPQPFLAELVIVLAAGGGGGRPKVEREWCEFHEHGSEEEKRGCEARLERDPVAGRAVRRIRDSRGWKGLVLKKGKR